MTAGSVVTDTGPICHGKIERLQFLIIKRKNFQEHLKLLQEKAMFLFLNRLLTVVCRLEQKLNLL